jgi:hypothetical protein
MLQRTDAMKPIIVGNSLFRQMNSLFSETNSLFRAEQGKCP